MKEVYYYLNLNAAFNNALNRDDRVSDKRELLVNCAGSINTRIKHKSINQKGRLDYYLLYVTEGCFSFSTNEIKKELHPGDIIVVPPSTGYIQELNMNENLNYLWVHFTGSNVNGILEELGINFFPCVNKTKKSSHLQSRFSQLFDCFLKSDRLRERDLSSSLERLLIEISRAVEGYEKPKVSLSKSISYITNNYTSPIKIPDLAKLEGMSVTRYNLHFKEQMGVPPTKYIISLRLNMAKELLGSSDLTLNQVGAACGYEDYNFFAKTFKSVFGVSPRKYKSTVD